MARRARTPKVWTGRCRHCLSPIEIQRFDTLPRWRPCDPDTTKLHACYERDPAWLAQAGSKSVTAAAEAVA